MQSIGKEARKKLAELHLDPSNPRLPPDVQGRGEHDLARYIDRHYEPIAIARSIAKHGFFLSEPLIVTPRDDGEFTVLEGNRRLVALLGLTNSELRPTLEDPEAWAKLAGSSNLPTEIPVIVVDNPTDVAPIIGYRHISGIQPWSPLAKARFIAHLADDQEHPQPFAVIASLVGDDESDVRSAYRNYRIVEDAKTQSLETEGVEKSFGVFNRAMSTTALRDHVQAPAPRDVVPGQPLVDGDNREAVAELTSWLFGGIDGQGKVVDESRDISTLARVVADEDALEALRSGHTLGEADELAGGAVQSLLTRLRKASGFMKAARGDARKYKSEREIIDAVTDCVDTAQSLRDD